MNNPIELERQIIQRKIDSSKEKLDRNILGQYSTPFSLADEVIKSSLKYLTDINKINFLDPAFGTGVFYSALKENINTNFNTTGFEIDKSYANASKKLWEQKNVKILIADFFKVQIPKKEDKYNLIICNPPYVRHQHLTKEQKQNLQAKTKNLLNFKISGLAGLYCYFLAYSLEWMQKDGIGVWLIPSEFLDVNYGSAIKDLLLNNVDLLKIHTFNPDNQQFKDALVSSTLVWFKNSTKNTNKTFLYSYGGSIITPQITHEIKKENLDIQNKWSNLKKGYTTPKSQFTLAQIFKSKRGLATGDNKFFILTEEKINKYNINSKHVRPILPSPRYLKSNVIEKNRKNIEKKLFLLDVQLSEHQAKKDTLLWNYLKEGIGTTSEKFLCKSRKIWYLQEKRDTPSLFVTYMGRKKENQSPFRFILNKSNVIANNSYLYLYPNFELTQSELFEIWNYLNTIPAEKLISEGRVYGGGLHKLEPKELLNIEINSIIDKVPSLKEKISLIK